MCTDLFELAVHTSDHHWELESHITAYINVDQLAELPCPSRMTSSKVYKIIRVPSTNADFRQGQPTQKGLYYSTFLRTKVLAINHILYKSAMATNSIC